MGRRERERGKRGERMLAKELALIWGDQIKRSASQSRGVDEPDLINAPCWVECKFQKRPSIHAAVAQACSDADNACDDRPILVATKRDREQWLITQPIDDYRATILDERQRGAEFVIRFVLGWLGSRCEGCAERLAESIGLDDADIGAEWPRGATKDTGLDGDSACGMIAPQKTNGGR